MLLTTFVAVAIISCDVLIYFLYEWAFGECERIGKRHARSSRFWADSPEGKSSRTSPGPEKRAAAAPAIAMKRKEDQLPAVPAQVNVPERLAYRRLVASFAPAKPRT